MVKNNEKSIVEFKKLVELEKANYLREKMEYGRNYTFKEESLGEFEYFMICNSVNATKLNYSHELKFIVHKHIIMSDVATLTEMKEKL
jgi:hypothetical protein